LTLLFMRTYNYLIQVRFVKIKILVHLNPARGIPPAGDLKMAEPLQVLKIFLLNGKAAAILRSSFWRIFSTHLLRLVWHLTGDSWRDHRNLSR